MKKRLIMVLAIVFIITNVIVLLPCAKENINEYENNASEESKVELKNHGMDVSVVEDILHRRSEKDGKKIAFLTFDDGPSNKITPKILDVLKENNVKATFFVCGCNIKEQSDSKILLKRALEEGHSIGNHTCSHSYSKLYPNENVNIEFFLKEVEDTNNLLKEAIGSDFTTRLVRMPNGEMTRKHNKDKNIDRLIEKLKEKDMYSVDWNALTGDEEGKRNKNTSELLRYLKKTSKDKEKLVILMHDSRNKKNTLEALPEVIAYLKSEGFEFSAMK